MAPVAFEAVERSKIGDSGMKGDVTFRDKDLFEIKYLTLFATMINSWEFDPDTKDIDGDMVWCAWEDVCVMLSIILSAIGPAGFGVMNNDPKGIELVRATANTFARKMTEMANSVHEARGQQGHGAVGKGHATGE